MAQTRRAFNYVPPDFASAKAMSERRGAGFDGLFVDGTKFFKAKADDNQIRILPPTWEGAKHYSYPVKIHRNIGVGERKQTYLCLDQNEASPQKGMCPICAERREMIRNKASQKEVDELRAADTNIIYLVDRNKMSEGPSVWQISNRTDNEIISQSLIKRTQTYLNIVHPHDGFDVEFTRKGEMRNTEYRGFKIDRVESPLTDDPDKMEEWLAHIEDHPIPDILKYYPADRIKAVFLGQVESPADDPESESAPIRRERPAEQSRARPRESDEPELPLRQTAERAQPRERPPWNEDEQERPNGRDRQQQEEVRETKPEPRRARLDEQNERPEQQQETGSSVTSLKDRLRQRLANRSEG